MIRATGELDCFSSHICLREPSESEDKVETARRTQVVLKQVVERDEEAMTSPVGLGYPKTKVSVRKEVDSEEHHSAVEADLPIVKEGI
ncbi:hypothetical protein B296_00043815 [Ensete ventricosum]|uniref:Uncharacterized protein n=1 Tax=Ensete ventricosum TaxID=4639 RepID=A0A426X5V5_ENSVE|nr:hypothetical protein B296_00043815 [Ensete ventricosum]